MIFTEPEANNCFSINYTGDYLKESSKLALLKSPL